MNALGRERVDLGGGTTPAAMLSRGETIMLSLFLPRRAQGDDVQVRPIRGGSFAICSSGPDPSYAECAPPTPVPGNESQVDRVPVA